MINPGATRILKLPLSEYIGRSLVRDAGARGFCAGGRPTLRESPAPKAVSVASGRRPSICRRPPRRGHEPDDLALLVRGAALPQQARLMVFDDITEVVSAQRSAAWSEVARRLAHEIKNPLTPIQLSAERIAAPARGQAGGQRSGDAGAIGRYDRLASSVDEAARQRVSRLRATACGATASARSECAGGRRARAVCRPLRMRVACRPSARRSCRRSSATRVSCDRSSTTSCKTRSTRCTNAPTGACASSPRPCVTNSVKCALCA